MDHFIIGKPSSIGRSMQKKKIIRVPELHSSFLSSKRQINFWVNNKDNIDNSSTDNDKKTIINVMQGPLS